jgi:hypothetical protein
MAWTVPQAEKNDDGEKTKALPSPLFPLHGKKDDGARSRGVPSTLFPPPTG